MTTEPTTATDAPLPFWTVAIYLVELSYGGPEEGGWWHDEGHRVDHEVGGVSPTHLLTVFHDTAKDGGEDAANGYCAVLQKLLDSTANKGRRDKSSVLSCGVYEARVYNGHPPARFPDRKPTYE